MGKVLRAGEETKAEVGGGIDREDIHPQRLDMNSSLKVSVGISKG